MRKRLASIAAALAAFGAATAVWMTAPAGAITLHAGEFCSPAKQGYYHAHGYTCRRASDGRNRLFTYGGGGGRPSAPSRPALGHTVYLGRIDKARIRGHGCKLRSHRRLPDRNCSPGGYYKKATRREICRSGYASRVRHVTESTDHAVFAEYRIRHHSARTYEVDHIVPLELGGSNARGNLFPEPAGQGLGFHQKDRLEDRLHSVVCAGGRSLRTAQRAIARNWLRAYRRAF
jgi:hypothetical protein